MSEEQKTVGELLHDARVKNGLDVDTIAKDICVRSSYLSAIETGQHDMLPGNTFAIGFVRAYAKALAMDADALVQAFKEELGVKPLPVPVVHESRPTVQNAAPRRRLPAWLSPLGGIVGAALVWVAMGSSVAPFSIVADNEIVDPETDTAQLMAVQATLDASSLTPAAAAVAESPVDETAVSVDHILQKEKPVEAAVLRSSEAILPHSLFLPAANAMAPASSGRTDIMLSAHEDAWVRLAKEDGTEVWSGVLREGQSYRPLLEGSVFLSTSNAGAVALVVGKRELGPLGDRGEVVQGVALDGEKLLSSRNSGQPGVTGSR
jgi:cytoskeleton protein RodZ